MITAGMLIDAADALGLTPKELLDEIWPNDLDQGRVVERVEALLPKLTGPHGRTIYKILKIRKQTE